MMEAIVVGVLVVFVVLGAIALISNNRKKKDNEDGFDDGFDNGFGD